MNNEYCSPWLAKFQENGGYDCITDSINIVDAVGETVAEIDLRHYEQKRSGLLDMPSIRNAHKRAQLIAAAPQLLASCVQLLAICYSRGEKLGVAGGGPVIDGAIQAIETAGGELPSYHFLKNPE
jgi:hypothetical protein